VFALSAEARNGEGTSVQRLASSFGEQQRNSWQPFPSACQYRLAIDSGNSPVLLHLPPDRTRSPAPQPEPSAESRANPHKQLGRHTHKPSVQPRWSRSTTSKALPQYSHFERDLVSSPRECNLETQYAGFPHTAFSLIRCNLQLADDPRQRQSIWHREFCSRGVRTPQPSIPAVCTFPTCQKPGFGADCLGEKIPEVPAAG